MEMDKAHDEDHKILSLAKNGSLNEAPMHRFNMLPRVHLLLSKKAHQELFLNSGGCGILEKWLSQNPDGSYPPFQVVETVLIVLEQLPI